MSVTFDQVDASVLEVVAIESVNSADYVSQVFRCYEAGSVVMVKPSSTTTAWEVPKGLRIRGEISPSSSHGWHRFSLDARDGDDPAHLCFTSGTTGAPKGILLSHGALKDVVDRLNDAMKLGPDVREYVGVPVNYSFGFGRCRAVTAAGGSCFLPEHGFNPLQIVDMIRSGEINAISAVPTQWRAFFQIPHLLGDAGAKVRWIEIGSQWMSRAEKEQMKVLFPNALILQHYGLTEASRTTFLDISRAEGEELDSVGRAVGSTEVRVGDDGRIQIRGPHVGLGELRDGAVRPLVDEDGWLQTNDLGTIREGALFYGGRADDLINCGGTKVPAEAFEKALLQEFDVAGGLAVGPVADDLRGQAILVVAEDGFPHDQARLEATAQLVAARFGLGGPGTVRFARCEQIPRTATGKVQRLQLAGLAQATSPPASGAGRLAETPPAASGDPASLSDQIVSAWCSVLGMPSVPMDKSFTDLGGDSLSMISVMLQIERLKIPSEIARKVFEGKTIQQIVDDMEGRESSMSDSQVATKLGSRVINAIRGVLVSLVILVHWFPGVAARIPALASGIDLTPVFRLGTPGFALVFGLGWGYFQVPLYRANPARFLTVARRNAWLLLGGILLLAAATAAAESISPSRKGTDDLIVRSFYSVLIYYFLAVLASPMLLLPLVRSRAVVSTSLLMAMAAFGLGELARWLVDPTPGRGVLELARLMLVARYNIFVMAGTTFLGTALGAAYRVAAESGVSGRLPFIHLGVAIAGFGVVGTHQTHGFPAWLRTSGQEPWALATYTGVIMIACGCIQKAFEVPRPPKLVRKTIEALSIVGVLALPAFVLHEAVLPTVHVLRGIGLPSLVVVAVPVAAFLGAMAHLYFKMRRLYAISPSAG